MEELTVRRMKRGLQLAPLAIATLFVLSAAKPAQAASCFADLRDCYGQAASTQDGIWSMWALGLDCELTFTDCTRRAIVGR